MVNYSGTNHACNPLGVLSQRGSVMKQQEIFKKINFLKHSIRSRWVDYSKNDFEKTKRRIAESKIIFKNFLSKGKLNPKKKINELRSGIDSFGEQSEFDEEEANEHQTNRDRKQNSDLAKRFYTGGMDLEDLNKH